MRISDWSSDVCSSDLPGRRVPAQVGWRQLRQIDLVAHRPRHDERLFGAEAEPALRRGDDRDLARGEGNQDILFLTPLQAGRDDGFRIIAPLQGAPARHRPTGPARTQPPRGKAEANPTRK